MQLYEDSIMNDQNLARYLSKDQVMKAISGWTPILNMIIRNPKIPIGAKVLYALLWSYMNNKAPSVYPSRSVLAQQLDISEKSISKFSKQLVDLELIEKAQRGMNKSNYYRFLWPKTALFDAIPIKKFDSDQLAA